jgi:fumarate reductase flavoprotein subunit
MSKLSTQPRVVRAQAMPEGTMALPVVIVGGGSCGLTAGIAMRQAGFDCVVLERDATPTGSTALSSGFIPAAQTRLQKSLGIADSYELLIDDVMNKAHGRAPRPLVQAYAHAVTEAIDVLEGKGLPFEIVDGFLYPGHRVLRMHTMPEKTGATFMTRLEQLAQQDGVDILTEALVTELWVDAQDRILGVGYQRPDGQLEHLGCQCLLLACNGFGGNTQMVSELLPEMVRAVFAGHQGNDGTAIVWGQQLGLRMAAVGVVSNLGAGLADEHLTHEDVTRVVGGAADRIGAVFVRAMPGLLRA